MRPATIPMKPKPRSVSPISKKVGKQQLFPGVAHVPLHIVGEHAKEDVRAHAVLEAMVDGPGLEIYGLERAKRPFDRAQCLVVAHGIAAAHRPLGNAGTDDIDAIVPSLILGLCAAALPSLSAAQTGRMPPMIVDIASMPIGSQPSGFTEALTGHGKPARWQVLAPHMG
jgi:hypothetical protein